MINCCYSIHKMAGSYEQVCTVGFFRCRVIYAFLDIQMWDNILSHVFFHNQTAFMANTVYCTDP